MAQTLPTLTVTDAQAQRLLAVFGTADEYRRWLKKQLVDYVLYVEANQLVEQHIAQGQQDLGREQI